jgi:predicted AlkP superfamily phosphohydrolase/phosphomutase
MRSGSHARVLVVGLDMADGDLIRYWSRQGRLPNFAALVASGTLVELESPAELLHTSTWPTFATGVLPGRHGVYYPYQPKPGHQFARRIEADQYGATTFWSRADAEQRRCVAYDIPETFPERDFKGRAVFDWGTWARYGTSSAQPPVLLKELKSQFGTYPLGFEAIRLGFEYPHGLEQRLPESVRYKCATARWLLQRDEWDLAVIGFGETHPAGHYFWPAGVNAVGTGDEALFEQLFVVYAAVDQALGSLRDCLPSDATLFVASGDGVRPNHCGWHLLPALLNRLGFTSSGPTSPGGASPRQSSLVGRLPHLVSPGLKQQVAAWLPWRLRNRLSLWAQVSNVDWSQTRAFALPSDLEGCVRINMKGREPHGIVDPGAQYDDLCQEIRSRLEELENPTTGARAVRRVWIRNEVLPGGRQEELPDLIVTWNDEWPIVALASPRVGLVEGVNPDRRPGTHSTVGFLLAQGPDIPKGHQGRGRLVDVAPTVLQLLALPNLSDMDGRPLDLSPASKPMSS